MLQSLLLALTLHLQISPDSTPGLHSFHQEDIDTVVAVFKGRMITIKLTTGETYTYAKDQWSKEYDYKKPFAPKIEDAVGLLDRTFTKVEVPPSFPGGERAWKKYFRKVCVENQSLLDGQASATVYVQFIVGFDGTVDDVQPIGQNAPKALSDLAIRMIKEGPAWQPATQNGYKVTAYTRLKIDFE